MLAESLGSSAKCCGAEVRAWFTIGAKEVLVRLENGAVVDRTKLDTFTDAAAPPQELVETATASALELFHFRAAGHTVSISWRRMSAENTCGSNRGLSLGANTCLVPMQR
jgi:hypothetical protein